MKPQIRLFWFRRDLRLEDNVGLYHALNDAVPVMPIFIFDPHILQELPRDDARVNFLFDTLEEMRTELQQKDGSDIRIFHEEPLQVFQELMNQYSIEALYFNHDYEPYALQRDQKVVDFLESQGVLCRSFKDQVIFEKQEVVKKDGSPYVVYTPYKNRWLELLNPSVHLLEYRVEPLRKNFLAEPNPQAKNHRGSWLYKGEYSGAQIPFDPEN